MKKILFSAIAMVAFAGSAFASNEIVFEKQAETKIEYKVEISEGGPLLDVTDISCYSRLCGTLGGKKVCTEWVKVDCAGNGNAGGVHTEKKMTISDRPIPTA